MQDKSSAVFIPQQKITTRFWLINPSTFPKILSELKEFKPAIIPYKGTVDPYRHYDGRILFVFKGTELEKFHKALAIAQKHSALTELLVNDEWMQIKLPVNTVQTKTV